MTLISLRPGFCQPFWQAQEGSFGVTSQWLGLYLEVSWGARTRFLLGGRRTEELLDCSWLSTRQHQVRAGL